MTADAYPVPPLTVGHGPTELEAFLEPTCPYSKRAFEKFPTLVEAAGADRLTIRIRFLSQPWHLYSGVVTRAILASAAAAGAETAIAVMAGIYQDREAFEFDGHDTILGTPGPNDRAYHSHGLSVAGRVK